MLEYLRGWWLFGFALLWSWVVQFDCAWLLLLLVGYLQWREVFGCSLFWVYLLPLICCLLRLACFAGCTWFGLVWVLPVVLCWCVEMELLLLVGFWLGFILFVCLLLWF